MKERRQFQRIPFPSTTEVLKPNSNHTITRTIDLSINGIGIEQNKAIKIGQEMSLNINLPYHDMKKRIIAECIVYSISPNNDKYRIGMKFIRMNQQDKLSLRVYLSRFLEAQPIAINT